jgi:GNAT superfamily N-acetyltransferase
MFEVYARRPVEATQSEREAMIQLVVEGEAVSEANVRAGIERAEALIFCATEGRVVGVAALKVPLASYRISLARKDRANVPVPEKDYPRELGYVAVDPLWQRRGIGPFLSSQVVWLARGRGLFATTGNDAMLKKVLPGLAFHCEGATWAGDKEKLVLMLRKASG